MKIIHISDTHGSKGHSRLNVSDCDVLVLSGDIGGRTNNFELVEFLSWFEKQPARKKIWVAGNHDIILDSDFIYKQKEKLDSIAFEVLLRNHKEALELLNKYDVKYLKNTDYVFEGVKFWGSPYSPSFHREFWCFNADRGEEIKKVWSQIPSDTNVLITHTPPYGILDDVMEYAHIGEDPHVGCKDLLEVIKKRLFGLKLHCFGHIHDQYGVRLIPVSQTRRILFSNGAVLNNRYEKLIDKPLIINI